MSIDNEKIFSELPQSGEELEEGAAKRALSDQLRKMKDRAGGVERTDPKYVILKDFLSKLETLSFFEAFASLKDYEKHAIITRLQNESESFDGSIRVSWIRKLEDETYGIIVDEDGERRINFEKSVELEKILDEQRHH